MTIYGTPRTRILPAEEVAGHAWGAGFRGEALVTIVAIAKGESGFNAHAVGDINLTVAGEQSTGLWQVNYRPRRDGAADKPPRGPLYNLDPANNAAAAWQISGGGTNFRPWSVYTNGSYRKHVAEARAAATVVERRGGNPDAPAGSPATSTGAQGGAIVEPRLDKPDVDLLDPHYVAGGVGTIRIRGRELSGSIAAFLTEGRFELTADQTPELSLIFDDPGLTGLWASGLLEIGAPVDWHDLRFIIAAIEVRPGPAQEQLVVTCRDAGIEKLKEKRNPVTLSNQSPTELVDALCAGADIGRFLGQGSAARPSVGTLTGPNTDEQESHYDTIVRLARELGFIFGRTGNAWYFGRPTWLLDRGVPFRARWRPGDDDARFGLTGIPTCRRTRDDSDTEVRIDLELPRNRGEQVRPFMRCNFKGIPSFAGDYLVTAVAWDLDNGVGPVRVTAVSPRDPTPSGDTDVVVPTTQAVSNSKSALDFVAFAQRQAGDRYRYGAEVRLTDPDPGEYDCSELVEWALYQVGVKFPDGSNQQLAACRKAGTIIPIETAYRTRGALLFRVGAPSDHVAISLGDGKSTIEARGRAYGVVNASVSGRNWTAAGKVPGLLYTT